MNLAKVIERIFFTGVPPKGSPAIYLAPKWDDDDPGLRISFEDEGVDILPRTFTEDPSSYEGGSLYFRGVRINHELRTDSGPFWRVYYRGKKADFRKDDRPGGFKKDQIIMLREYVRPVHELPSRGVGYTGSFMIWTISDVTSGYGMPNGYCMISLGNCLWGDIRGGEEFR